MPSVDHDVTPYSPNNRSCCYPTSPITVPSTCSLEHHFPAVIYTTSLIQDRRLWRLTYRTLSDHEFTSRDYTILQSKTNTPCHQLILPFPLSTKLRSSPSLTFETHTTWSTSQRVMNGRRILIHHWDTL